ncbi:DUF3455 domain-containing protein [Oceanimonas sp. MB9]|uniref:DUF3455 domain-containing protein n=1 Tax=Oceanimonas sp. MB9 TaxID=2588453 RepID=UPI0013F5B952|nr:DUF3455 domain-containing protein [Oceanimonas sp. MB9]NHI00531.1 hypothetical protein [Oceanimonas sp. MB9]
MHNFNRKITPVLASALLLAPVAWAAVPDSVQVPAGNKVALETVGVGEITYECRAKADAADELTWVFMGPDAMLKDSGGNEVGRYFGPPATWQAADGSSVTGTQLAVAPGGDGNIPFQLVRANPAEGEGAMTGVTYIQRLNTQGGVAPAMACGQDNQGERQIVQYQADYLFWKAG